MLHAPTRPRTTVDDRVPVDQRVLGIDRRSIGFALPAVLVWLLWVVVLPWVDDQVDWDDPVVAGDQLIVTDEVTMTPPVGWQVQSGVRVSDDSAVGADTPPAIVLLDSGVTVTLTSGDWDGSPEDLLKQITKVTTTISGGDAIRVTAPTHTIRTDQGVAGVAEGFTSPRVSGVIAAFVYGGTGVEVQVTGPLEQMSEKSEEIATMIESMVTTADTDTAEASS